MTGIRQWLLDSFGQHIRTRNQARLLVVSLVVLVVAVIYVFVASGPKPPERDFEVLPGESVGSDQGLPR